MTARTFTRRWIIALTVLAAGVLLLPFFIFALVYISGCQRTGGACGALILLLSIFLRLPLVFGVAVYVSVQAWKRSVAIGLVPWGFLFVVVTFLAASPLMFGFGNFWAANFATGNRIYGTPLTLGFLLTGLCGLSLLSPTRHSSVGKVRATTLTIGAIAMVLLMPAAIEGLTLLPVINWVAFPVSRAVRTVLPAFIHKSELASRLLLLVAFAGSLTMWIIRSRATEALSIE